MKSAFRYLFGNLELIVSNLCLASLVLILGLQVFFRYVLHLGLSWSEEVSRFCFLWLVYISGSLAVQKGTHIRVTALLQAVPKAISLYLALAADLLWLCFNAAVIVSGIMLVTAMLRHPMYSTSLYLPLSYIYLVIPLAHTMMFYRILQGYWRRFRETGRLSVDFI